MPIHPLDDPPTICRAHKPPFNKVFVGALVWGGVGFGVGAIVYSWKFQNKKQVRVMWMWM